VIVSPTRLVGTTTVAPIVGITAGTLRRRVHAGDALVLNGYLGIVRNRHVWNLHELVVKLFTSEASVLDVVARLTDPRPADPIDTILCSVPECDDLELMVGLCRLHLRRLMIAWDHAGRSSLIATQLVAMCQWIVERNAHLSFPAGFDPWSLTCMTPGCDKPTNVNGWHGPLCPDCSAAFWGNSLLRRKPAHWNVSAA
jgi:hypothetical protein